MPQTLFPNETNAYREHRDRLLKAEIELKDARERVAELRRRLPEGPAVGADYTFTEGPRNLSQDGPAREVRLSELFENGHDDLIMVNFMYGAEDELPCPMCTMWADGYNAVAPHIEQRAGFVLVAKAPIGRLRAFARNRNWGQIRLLSSYESTFNRDNHVETEDGGQVPGVSVFHREVDGTICLFHMSEMMLSSEMNPRGIDLYSPVWNLFDLLPGGRGDWYPSLSH